MKNQQRIIWIDVLNIVACLGVLLLHCNHQSKGYDGEITLSWIYGLIIYTISYFPVPVFLMLSGCTLIGRCNSYPGGVKQFYRKRFNKTVIPFVFWSLFYFSFNLFVGWYDFDGIKNFISDFINARFNIHMWFFLPLFGIYLSMPFIETMLNNSSEKRELCFLLISFIFVSFLPMICEIADIKYFIIGAENIQNYGMFCMAGNMLFYAVWGHFLNRIVISPSWRKKIYLLGVLSAIVHFCGLYFMSIKNGSFDWTFLNYSYPTSVVMSIAVFVWFKNQNWDKFLSTFHIDASKISFVSSCSFGIYLIHRLIHNIGNHFGIPFQNPLYGFILTYLVGFTIIVIMKKIPIINKIVP